MSITTAWGQDVDFIEGADLVDKAELIGKAFLITGIRFERNARGVEYAYIEAEDEAGEEFDFNDSSTSGVKQQLVTYLESRHTPADFTTGEVHDVKIAVPRGLRVSTYEVQDMRGKTKMAKTYYLTGGGRAARRQQTAGNKD
ncbi:hypothetical protein [Streptomyces sp. ISBFB 2968]|uniref:hypothetical protein n=1 Tax=Streptomyces sp. ISBFB 2968 TaxID=2903527 RepID=UPI002FDC3F4C